MQVSDKIKYISIADPDFPRVLRYIHNPPSGLYYIGTLPKSFSNAIAIVGARRCSAYGRSATEDVSSKLAKAGMMIISGMAKGIDSAAHAGALSVKGTTVAVLGCGVDVCYPESSRNIYNNIIETGCIISEYKPGTMPLPGYFPQRNRIISGLSRAVLVMEAAKKSGSLITADFALDQGRDVYALPGRITDPLSEGTNYLISQGAGIINSTESLFQSIMESGYIGSLENYENIRKSTGEFFVLEKQEEVVYSCLDFYPMGIDEIMQKVGMPLPGLLEVLSSLLEKGVAGEEGKNRYVRLGIKRPKGR